MPEFSLTAEDVGERLDRYVTRQLPMHSRAYVQQLIDEQQILVDGRATFEPLPRGWVHQSQSPGMQRLPVKPGQLVRQRRARQCSVGVAISGIAQQRMPYSSHVDADLMGAAGARPQFHHGVEPEALQHAKFGNGLASHSRVRRHLLPVHWMPADGGVDHSFSIANIAVYDRQIPLLHLAVGEQAR